MSAGEHRRVRAAAEEEFGKETGRGKLRGRKDSRRLVYIDSRCGRTQLGQKLHRPPRGSEA